MQVVIYKSFFFKRSIEIALWKLNKTKRQRKFLSEHTLLKKQNEQVKQSYWRVWSWLRTNAGGVPNTCKSSEHLRACSQMLAADGWVTRGQPAYKTGITSGNRS